MSKKFPKQELIDRIDERDYISNEMRDTGRWNITYRMVFADVDGKTYSSCYSVGATEMQDELPYEYEDDEIECREVFPVKKEITVYE